MEIIKDPQMTIKRGSIFRACPIKSAFTCTWQRFNGIQFRVVGKLYSGGRGRWEDSDMLWLEVVGKRRLTGSCHLTWWVWGRGHILFSLIHPQLGGRMRNSEARRHWLSPECSGAIAAELVGQSFAVMYGLLSQPICIVSHSLSLVCAECSLL